MTELVRQEKVTSPADDPLGYAWREATALASSPLVPEVHRGRPENCLIAMNLARRIDGDPFTTLSNMYVIKGRASFSTAFLIGCFNRTGKFGPIQYRLSGEEGTKTWECVAWCRDREFGDVIEGPPVTYGDAIAEGWVGKSGSKWKTLPGLMLRYRSATFLIRTTAPEIMCGLYTSEEVHDMNLGSEGETARKATEALEAAQPEKDVTPDEGRVAETHDETGGFDPPEEIDPETGEVVPADLGAF